MANQQHSIVHRVVAWSTVALGGPGDVVPNCVHFARSVGACGFRLAGTYFEAASGLHAPS